MARKKSKLARRQRRHNSLLNGNAAPQVTVTGGAVSTPTSTALMTFSGNVMLTGVPPRMTIGGNPITSLAQVSSTVVRVTQTTPNLTLAGQAYIIPASEPAIRTPVGGFVTAKAGTF